MYKRAILTTDILLGTDAIVILDGRWSDETIDCVVYDAAFDRKRLHTGTTFTGYEVYGPNQRSHTDRPLRTVTFAKPL